MIAVTKIRFEASLEKLGKRFPLPLQRFLVYPYVAILPSMRLGKVFWETYNFLQESQWWSRERLEEYQMQQLKKLLHHAYENVPYYRRIFDERGLKPKNIRDSDDLTELPCLDKDTFKWHFNEMIARNVKLADSRVRHTSGTTGKPLRFYEDHSVAEKEWAFHCHQWSRVGYKPGESLVQLRGSIIFRKNPVAYNPIRGTRIMRLSPRTNTKEVSQYYLKMMKSFGAKFLHGYPSAIVSFAHMLRRHGLVVPFKLKAILFASEVVYDWEREIVQEVFKCQVLANYGQAERVTLAAGCEHDHYYHFVPQYGITEINPDTNEIIATGFLNSVNPFIRYRTSDVVSPVLSKCEHCRRSYFPIVERIEGRFGDFFVTAKAALVSPTVVSFCLEPLIYKYSATIKECRMIQTSVDKIIWQVTSYDKNLLNIRKADLQRLRQDLKDILGSNIQVNLEVVDEIERLKSGKLKMMMSEVSKDLMEKGLDSF